MAINVTPRRHGGGEAFISGVLFYYEGISRHVIHQKLLLRYQM